MMNKIYTLFCIAMLSLCCIACGRIGRLGAPPLVAQAIQTIHNLGMVMVLRMERIFRYSLI